SKGMSNQGINPSSQAKAPESSPTIFLVMADPQARGTERRHVRRVRGGRGGHGRRIAALAALVLGVAGFAISMAGVAIWLLPRQFTAGQQRQIMAWEVSGRWQTLTAGQIFPAS